MELIAEVEIEEEITELEISADKDGKPFKLKEALLFYYFPKYTGETSIPSFNGFGMINDKITGKANTRPLTYTSTFMPPRTTYDVSGHWKIRIKNGIRHETRSNMVGNLDGYAFGESNICGGYVINDQIGTIQSIGFKKGLAYAGCKFILYGVRA